MTSLNQASVGLLETVFGNAHGQAWIAWKGNMGGGRANAVTIPAGVDTYFSVALMAPGATGRTNDQAERVFALVIDDVGTKIDMGAFRWFAPAPTWELETSPGNWQMGYAIRGGCSVEEYAQLRAAMRPHPVWGRSDGTDAVHLFRLPQGRNSKHTPWFGVGNTFTGTGYSYLFEPLAEAMAGPGAPQGSGMADVVDVIEDPLMLEALVGLVPNDQPDRDYWVSMAHAVWGASSGVGEEVFLAWSSKWTEGVDDPAANTKLWASISGSGIGRGWLLREARERSGAAVDAWTQDEARAVFDDEDDMGLLSPGAPTEAVVTPHHRTVAWEVEKKVGARMRFNHDNGCWHTFGSTWAIQPGSVRAGFNEAWKWVNDNILSMTAQEVKQTSKADFYAGVETILKQRLGIRHVDFDRDPWLLGTPGGTVDLRTGALRGAVPGEFISKSTAVTPAAEADCPRWKRFILEITKKDMEAATFLQQWAGYCLSGDTTEQVFLFLYGPGGNGKSVLMDTLGRLLGDYFVKPVADLYFARASSRHMQEVAMLAGARMVTVSEVPPNAAWDEGKLKDHTGGGKVTANFMRQNSFSFEPQFKLTALGNHQPVFPGGMNAAIKRRFRLMLLDYKPPVMDPDLLANLWKEAPGILRWCIEGLTDPGWGWHRTRLMVPASMQKTTEAYVHDQDVFGLWIEERIVPLKDGKVSVTELFNDWDGWRHANGGREMATNSKAFSQEMQQRGFKGLRTNTFRGFSGIALKPKVNSPF